MSAIFSAIMTVETLVLPRTTVGITEVSTTRRPLAPCPLSRILNATDSTRPGRARTQLACGVSRSCLATSRRVTVR